MPISRPLSTSLLGAALTAGMTLAASAASAQGIDSLAGLSAGRVAVISDGDFVARTYADAVLAPAEAGYRDVLTVLSIADGKVTRSELALSNSVTAAPEVLELTPDGRTAFVAERLGERTKGATRVKDLPAGNRLFAVDLSDPASPRLADTAQIGIHPEGLAVSPDGTRVAVVSNTAEESLLQIVAFSDGRFGTVARFNLADLGVTGSTDGPRKGVTATNVQWHPSGRYLAANITTQNRVAFFEVGEAAGTATLKPWGNIVETGRDPFVGRFTPDGGYYLTSNWGRDFSATTLDGRIPEAASTMSVIRLADPEAETVRHESIASVETDVSAEGMAVSPDGRLVATFNMRGTSFAAGTPRHGREAGISLMGFEPETGVLRKLDDYSFEAVLPEGGTFDLTGDHLIATSFEAQPDAEPGIGAGLAVFRVIRDGTPRLEPVGRVALPHGVHHVDVAR
jgi:DNA-binding beta-propeller fold protein YncE